MWDVKKIRIILGLAHIMPRCMSVTIESGLGRKQKLHVVHFDHLKLCTTGARFEEDRMAPPQIWCQI